LCRFRGVSVKERWVVGSQRCLKQRNGTIQDLTQGLSLRVRVMMAARLVRLEAILPVVEAPEAGKIFNCADVGIGI